jgi:hypothetical protein
MRDPRRNFNMHSELNGLDGIRSDSDKVKS